MPPKALNTTVKKTGLMPKKKPLAKNDTNSIADRFIKKTKLQKSESCRLVVCQYLRSLNKDYKECLRRFHAHEAGTEQLMLFKQTQQEVKLGGKVVSTAAEVLASGQGVSFLRAVETNWGNLNAVEQAKLAAEMPKFINRVSCGEKGIETIAKLGLQHTNDPYQPKFEEWAILCLARVSRLTVPLLKDLFKQVPSLTLFPCFLRLDTLLRECDSTAILEKLKVSADSGTESNAQKLSKVLINAFKKHSNAEQVEIYGQIYALVCWAVGRKHDFVEKDAEEDDDSETKEFLDLFPSMRKLEIAVHYCETENVRQTFPLALSCIGGWAMGIDYYSEGLKGTGEEENMLKQLTPPALIESFTSLETAIDVAVTSNEYQFQHPGKYRFHLINKLPILPVPKLFRDSLKAEMAELLEKEREMVFIPSNKATLLSWTGGFEIKKLEAWYDQPINFLFSLNLVIKSRKSLLGATDQQESLCQGFTKTLDDKPQTSIHKKVIGLARSIYREEGDVEISNGLNQIRNGANVNTIANSMKSRFFHTWDPAVCGRLQQEIVDTNAEASAGIVAAAAVTVQNNRHAITNGESGDGDANDGTVLEAASGSGGQVNSGRGLGLAGGL